MTVVHEVVHQILDEGFRYEVGPDRDGLGLTEIRYIEDGKGVVERMTFSDEHLAYLAQILVEIVQKKIFMPGVTEWIKR